MTKKQGVDYSAPFRFNQTTVEGIPTGQKIAYFYDTVVQGLGVTRRVSGALTFHVCTTMAGRTQRTTIPKSKYPEMSVDVARAKAKGILGDVVNGADPVKERRAQRASQAVAELTVEEAVELFCKNKWRRHVHMRKSANKAPHPEGLQVVFIFCVELDFQAARIPRPAYGQSR